jgi:hypothetical protein
VWDPETQSALDAIDRDLSAKRSELERAEKIAKLADEGPAYRALFGQEFKHGGYTLSFLQELKQDWTVIGRYSGFEGRSMRLSDGDYCWQVKKGREATISLVCGNESRIIGITEPSTCAYSATFVTPAACSSEDVDALAQLTLVELRALAERAGISAGG